MKKLLVILLCLGLCGCATMPTQKQIDNLDYGAYPTIDYKQAIKNCIGDRLYDPYSAVYEFEAPPQRGWYKEPPLLGGRLYAGYITYVNINAKNRMGGYTGRKRYGVIFKNDRIIKVIEPMEYPF